MEYENFDIKNFVQNKLLQNSNIILIASRPGVGKTTFAIHIIKEILDKNKNIMFFSLENNVIDLSHRIYNIFKNQTIFEKITTKDIYNEIDNMTFHYYDYEIHLSNEQKQEKILEKIETNSNTSLIVFDYLQLYKFDEKFLEKLKSINIPILILSQLDRKSKYKNIEIVDKKTIREIRLLDKYVDIFLFLDKKNNKIKVRIN